MMASTYVCFQALTFALNIPCSNLRCVTFTFNMKTPVVKVKYLLHLRCLITKTTINLLPIRSKVDTTFFHVTIVHNIMFPLFNQFS